MCRIANPDNADRYRGETPFLIQKYHMHKAVIALGNKMRDNNVGPKDHFLIDQNTNFHLGPMTEAQCDRIISENPKRTMTKRQFNYSADNWEDWLTEIKRR